MLKYIPKDDKKTSFTQVTNFSHDPYKTLSKITWLFQNKGSPLRVFFRKPNKAQTSSKIPSMLLLHLHLVGDKEFVSWFSVKMNETNQNALLRKQNCAVK